MGTREGQAYVRRVFGERAGLVRMEEGSQVSRTGQWWRVVRECAAARVACGDMGDGRIVLGYGDSIEAAIRDAERSKSRASRVVGKAGRP